MPEYHKTTKQRAKAHHFYRNMLDLLAESKIPYLLSGAFGMYEYTGLKRLTKDIDVFCLPEDYPRMLQYFSEKGYKAELTDERWLAKIKGKRHFMDIIWSTASQIYSVKEKWFENAHKGQVLGREALIMGPEEIIFTKLFVRNRERYDGADVNHILLQYGKKLNWERLMTLIENHWPLLLIQLLEFLFVYPEGREIVPSKVIKELLERQQEMLTMPPPQTKICRGPLIDHTQYLTDIHEWGYKAVTLFSI